MLIVGAKGFAKEVLEVLFQADPPEAVAFYDDVSPDLPATLYGRFPVLRTPAQARRWFAADARFVLGLGTPRVRRLLAEKMRQAGGELTSTVSPLASIGRFGNALGAGCNVMTGAVLTSDITLGEGVLVNLNCTIGHDVVVGDYCELSPGVHLSGHVQLGEGCVLGTGAVVLPGLSIGPNSVVGAGSVVTKSIGANVLAVGIPAKPIKELPLLTLASTHGHE
jgi:sugar O-acyltransferase (sialic acid O-acetyltransferase NeuD family)